jgi:hypothetical protein
VMRPETKAKRVNLEHCRGRGSKGEGMLVKRVFYCVVLAALLCAAPHAQGRERNIDPTEIGRDLCTFVVVHAGAASIRNICTIHLI